MFEKETPHALLDRIKNSMLQGLVVMALGCDAPPESRSRNIHHADGNTVEEHITIPDFEAPRRVGDRSLNTPPTKF